MKGLRNKIKALRMRVETSSGNLNIMVTTVSLQQI